MVDSVLKRLLKIMKVEQIIVLLQRIAFLVLKLCYDLFQVKVACRVQIWKKKHFVKIVTSLVTVLFKMT